MRLTKEYFEEMARDTLKRQFNLPPQVILYDQFGREVYVPSTACKIGDTITIRKPSRFVENLCT